MPKNPLKTIPSVSEILAGLPADINLPQAYSVRLINQYLDEFRSQARRGKLSATRRDMINATVAYVMDYHIPRIKNIINGTGIILHTGLGRAPISGKHLERLSRRLSGYVNLEYDLPANQRGERNDHVGPVLAALAGAEAGLVVNNNAAAVWLTLNTLAAGQEIIISRGQQVEIGGSFRIPDVIDKSQAVMREVGTTNRTHLRDYREAIGDKTGAILWAHTSNYRIAGFTAAVSLAELVSLGAEFNLPVIADLGSGALIDFADYGLPHELTIAQVMEQGVDVATFSGDKLLGGPQSGLIVGQSRLIRRIHQNPVYRAVRCDKLIISLLEDVLGTYGNEEPVLTNLTLELLTTGREILRSRGEDILAALPAGKQEELGLVLVESEVEAGSGSLPTATIPSIALRFKPPSISATRLARALRTGGDPVVGYLRDQQFFIDLKAVLPTQITRLVAAISAI